MKIKSKLWLTKIAAILGLVSLVSCAPIMPFQSSAASNAVKVEIKVDQMQARRWTLYTFDNDDTCQGRKVVASSTSNASSDVRVDAGKRHTYMLFLDEGGSFCRIAVSFDAKAGNIYGIRIAADRNRCYMAALNTTKMIDGEKEPTVARRTIQSAIVESGSWCAPLNPADIGKSIESSTNDPNQSQLPKTPDGFRQGTSLDDLKDLLPRPK